MRPLALLAAHSLRSFGQPDRRWRQAHLYQYCANVTGGFPKWGPSFTDCTGVYDGCTGMGGVLPAWPKSMTKCDQCYRGTAASGIIPAWPDAIASGRNCYQNCTGLTEAWTDDPVLLMPESMNLKIAVENHNR